jgi:flagellar hook protein FlgE
LFSQTIAGPRAAVAGFGGSNPMQVGLGVRLGTIDVSHQQGALLTTGVASDLAIQGQGFFILSDGATNFYSRDGSFTLNSNGELIDGATGLRVQGYLADSSGNIDPTGVITDLVVPLGGVSIVQASTQAEFVGNLDSGAAAGDTVDRTFRVYDSLGSPRDITITFTKSATTNEWDWAASTTDPDVASVTGAGTITFDTDGNVTAGGTATIDVSFVGGIPSAPVDPFSFTADFSAVTNQSGGGSDITFFSQDGYPRGVLESFNIGQGGVINGVFTNGLTQTLGQVATASFPNNGGLSREGNNLFRDSPSSGVPQIGIPGTGGRGQVSGGVLEGSNVDLGREFSELIITQRAFQANARTITTADTLLQETVNLIR